MKHGRPKSYIKYKCENLGQNCCEGNIDPSRRPELWPTHYIRHAVSSQQNIKACNDCFILFRFNRSDSSLFAAPGVYSFLVPTYRTRVQPQFCVMDRQTDRQKFTSKLSQALRNHTWVLNLTHSMKHNPSPVAKRSSATQEVPRILWNPKVHYRIHNSRHLFLSWAKSIQSAPPSHYSKIYFNIIIPSTTRSRRISPSE
jgi:hypothetical protein